MVKIINGEIVQDNDPRLKQRSQPSSSSSGVNNNPRAGRRNVADVFGSGGSADGGNANRSGQGGEDRQQGAPQQQQPQNPLDMIATHLGIQDRIVTIPAVAPLGLTESHVGLIYICAIVLACFFFGFTAALLAVVFYVLWKKSGKNNPRE